MAEKPGRQGKNPVIFRRYPIYVHHLCYHKDRKEKDVNEMKLLLVIIGIIFGVWASRFIIGKMKNRTFSKSALLFLVCTIVGIALAWLAGKIILIAGVVLLVVFCLCKLFYHK